MGQTHAGGSQQESGLGHVQSRLRQHAELFRRIAKLSYKEFKDSVEELNRVYVITITFFQTAKLLRPPPLRRGGIMF